MSFTHAITDRPFVQKYEHKDKLYAGVGQPPQATVRQSTTRHPSPRCSAETQLLIASGGPQLVRQQSHTVMKKKKKKEAVFGKA